MTKRLLASLLLCLAIAGCTSDLPAAVRTLDELEAKLEEFGAITVSPPMLVGPDGARVFDLDRTSEQYFSEASRNEGAVAGLDQRAFYLAFGASAQYDPTQAAAYAEQLRTYYAKVSRLERVQSAKDRAAEVIFHAEMAAAEKETDPAKQAQMRADALAKLAASLGTEGDAPSFPVAGDNLPSPASGLAKPPDEARKPLANEGKFLGPGALLPTGFAPHIPNRSAIITAAGDETTEATLRMLLQPAEAQRFRDKAVFFGAVSVSVDPGWRTRKGYVADVSVQASVVWGEAPLESDSWSEAHREEIEEFRNEGARAGAEASTEKAKASAEEVEAREKTRKCPECCGIGPDISGRIAVSAVSPMQDAQVLDLASSQRSLTELSLLLAAAGRVPGLAAQAELITQYVKSRQLDAQTQTAAGIASSYSSGDIFGYHVGPRLRGLDPADPKSKPADVLERQSFPSLVVFGFDRVLLERPFQLARCIKRKPKTNEIEDQWNVVLEPQLRLVQTSRWIPIDAKRSARGRRWSAVERIGVAERLVLGLADLAKNKSLTPPVEMLLRQRVRVAKTLANGSFDQQRLPPEIFLPRAVRMPKPLTIAPTRAVLAADASGAAVPLETEVTISGSDLDAIDPKKVAVFLGAAELVGTPRVEGGAIVARLKLKGAGPVALELPVDGPKAKLPAGMSAPELTSPVLLVEFTPPKPCPECKREATKCPTCPTPVCCR